MSVCARGGESSRGGIKELSDGITGDETLPLASNTVRPPANTSLVSRVETNVPLEGS